MKHSDMKMDKKTVKKAVGMHDKQMHGGKKTNLSALKKGGMAMKKMAAGGMPMVEKDGKKVPAFAADGKGKMACGGKVKGYAAGGMASGTIRRKPKVSSENRLANANMSQSDSDIAPNFKPRSTSEDRLSSANKKQMNTSMGPNLKSKRARSDGGLQVSVDEPKKESFGDAFKAARKADKKTFMYNGKSYTTETAAEKDKKQSKPMPSGNIGSRTMMEEDETAPTFKRGGKPKCMAKGGGIESKGKTRGRFC